jgi:hypothetical protein
MSDANMPSFKPLFPRRFSAFTPLGEQARMAQTGTATGFESLFSIARESTKPQRPPPSEAPVIVGELPLRPPPRPPRPVVEAPAAGDTPLTARAPAAAPAAPVEAAAPPPEVVIPRNWGPGPRPRVMSNRPPLAAPRPPVERPRPPSAYRQGGARPVPVPQPDLPPPPSAPRPAPRSASPGAQSAQAPAPAPAPAAQAGQSPGRSGARRGEDDLEGRLRKLLGEGPDADAELRDAVKKVVGAGGDPDASSAKIQLLERKLARLAGTLEEAERQRDEAQAVAAALEAQGPAPARNIYGQGVNEDDPQKGKKLALMKSILEDNRALRAALGIATAAPSPVASAEAAPPVAAPSSDPVASIASAEAAPPAAPSNDDLSVDADTDAVSEGGAASEVDPDDLEWEFTPFEEPEVDGAVKRIDVASLLGKGGPPLERS